MQIFLGSTVEKLLGPKASGQGHHDVASSDPQPPLAHLVSSLSALTTVFSAGATAARVSEPDAGTSMSASMPPEQEPARVLRFKQELMGSCINIHALKRLAFHGIPDSKGLRAVVWKVDAPTIIVDD